MSRPYSSPGTKVLLSILVGAAVDKPAGWMNRKYLWGPSRGRARNTKRDKAKRHA
jgi:hypothetical protein